MSKYCTSPWVSLFVHHDNKVKSCCAGRWDWGDLSTQPLDQIINNPKVQQLKNDIRNGIPNSYCGYCADVEKLGSNSQREYFQQFEISDETYNSDNAFQLQQLDIRWTNLCNLNCVYCNPGWSTTWQKAMKMPIDAMHYDFHNKILNYINENGKQVKAVILAGGEPLLHRQNVQLVQSLEDNASIDVITNLSINLSSSPVYRELLKKRVNWTVSIDNINDRFEYVRHNANWEQMLENLKILKSVENFSAMLFPVYNIYNCTRLIEFFDFANEVNMGMHWQMLTSPNYMCVYNFSDKVKQLAIDEIEKLFASETFAKFCSNPLVQTEQSKTFLTSVLKELKNSTVTNADAPFLKWVKEYETKYATDVKTFRTLYPELYMVM